MADGADHLRLDVVVLMARWDVSKMQLAMYCNTCGKYVASPHVCGEVPTEGRKEDGGKLRYDLIPPELLEAVSDILTFGANKYSARNWEKGMRWGRPFAALMRHMWKWWRREDVDPETGKSHLWHAACCIAFLIAFEARGIGTDDRPT